MLLPLLLLQLLLALLLRELLVVLQACSGQLLQLVCVVIAVNTGISIATIVIISGIGWEQRGLRERRSGREVSM